MGIRQREAKEKELLHEINAAFLSLWCLVYNIFMLFTKATISEAGKCLNEKYIMLKLDNHKNTNFSKHLLFSQT